MSNVKELFYEMKNVVQQEPEKFFMNVHDYRGKRYAMFDYSLVIPAHFNSSAAFECRGSVFEVDANNDFVRIVCRPYEKFLNVHEYDYHNNEPLYAGVKEKYGINITSSDDIKKLPIAYALTKEDGSIISSFIHDGALDLKSNSSLTSEYKEKAYEILCADEKLYRQSDELTQLDYTVIYEFVSDYWKYRIILPYEKEQLIVTGVRHNQTGNYLTHKEMVEHFGAEYVVKVVDIWDWDDRTHKEDIEGYVLVFECGLRCKLKVEWYVERHNVKSSLMSSPRHFWETFINGKVDDVFMMVQHDAPMVAHFEDMIGRCSDLYNTVMNDGIMYYDLNKYKDVKSYFLDLNKDQDNLTYFMSYTVAAQLYQKSGDVRAAAEYTKNKMLIHKNISLLGISAWT